MCRCGATVLKNHSDSQCVVLHASLILLHVGRIEPYKCDKGGYRLLYSSIAPPWSIGFFAVSIVNDDCALDSMSSTTAFRIALLVSMYVAPALLRRDQALKSGMYYCTYFSKYYVRMYTSRIGISHIYR